LSSSRDDWSFATFIGASLETLSNEFSTAYHLLYTQLASRSVLLVIDDEAVVLAFDREGAHVLPELGNPTIRLQTSRQTILDVIDARLTLLEAVLEDSIVLQGDTESLAAFHEGLLTYIQGAIRCPSFPALLDHFRYASTQLLHCDVELSHDHESSPPWCEPESGPSTL
jgi:hypothetical protein